MDFENLKFEYEKIRFTLIKQHQLKTVEFKTYNDCISFDWDEKPEPVFTPINWEEKEKELNNFKPYLRDI